MITANEVINIMPICKACEAEYNQRIESIETAIIEAAKHDEYEIEVGIKNDKYCSFILVELERCGYKVELRHESIWKDGISLYNVSWLGGAN